MGKVAQLYQEDDLQRSKVMGRVLSGMAMGVLIGYPFGGIMYQVFGKSAPFVIISLVGVVLLLNLHKTLGPLKLEKLAENEEMIPDDSLSHYQMLLDNVFVLIITGSIGISTTAMAVLEPCLPIWLMQKIKPQVFLISQITFK